MCIKSNKVVDKEYIEKDLLEVGRKKMLGRTAKKRKG